MSNFSLNFLVIGSSNPGEPRDKVAPHGKSYAWILVLGSFDKMDKGVGVIQGTNGNWTCGKSEHGIRQ